MPAIIKKKELVKKYVFTIDAILAQIKYKQKQIYSIQNLLLQKILKQHIFNMICAGLNQGD